jgi:hypothetical protein
MVLASIPSHLYFLGRLIVSTVSKLVKQASNNSRLKPISIPFFAQALVIFCFRQAFYPFLVA